MWATRTQSCQQRREGTFQSLQTCQELSTSTFPRLLLPFSPSSTSIPPPPPLLQSPSPAPTNTYGVNEKQGKPTLISRNSSASVTPSWDKEVDKQERNRRAVGGEGEGGEERVKSERTATRGKDQGKENISAACGVSHLILYRIPIGNSLHVVAAMNVDSHKLTRMADYGMRKLQTSIFLQLRGQRCFHLADFSPSILISRNPANPLLELLVASTLTTGVFGYVDFVSEGAREDGRGSHLNVCDVQGLPPRAHFEHEAEV